MGQVSRPLIALLVATVAFFALWIVALKPSSSSTSAGGTGPGLGAYQNSINQAHKAVSVSAQSDAASAGQSTTSATTAAPAVTTKRTAAVTTRSAAAVTTRSDPARAAVKPVLTIVRPPAAHAGATPVQRLAQVNRALAQHKVLALLFFNPAAADDKAVKQELAAVPTPKGRVVKLAVPISELSRYTAVTTQVPVNLSPTLVLIDPAGAASTIVGFTDRFEIAQRVLDALAVK